MGRGGGRPSMGGYLDRMEEYLDGRSQKEDLQGPAGMNMRLALNRLGGGYGPSNNQQHDDHQMESPINNHRLQGGVTGNNPSTPGKRPLPGGPAAAAGKTMMCQNFLSYGVCAMQDMCLYAHSSSELMFNKRQRF